MMKYWLAVLSFLIGQMSFAHTCYFTVVKEDCWRNYELSVKLLDFDSRAQVGEVKIPKGKLWGRVKFECKPRQSFLYNASFLPVMWENEAGRLYWGVQASTLPAVIGKDEQAWHLRVCFPRQFSRVPFPPDATKACQCDWGEVPAIKAVKPE